MAGAWMAAMIAASARSAPWWAKLSIYKVTTVPNRFPMKHCSILAANTANQSRELMDLLISMNWTMLAASSYAVRIPWCCSMQCPTSPCCLEMATVLMKGLHLRCAPRWELSIRLRHGSSTNRCNYRSNSPAAFETTPKSTSFQASLLSVPSFFRRNHSPKIIGSCANSGETKRADAVSQRHGGPFSMRHWHSKIKEVP